MINVLCTLVSLVYMIAVLVVFSIGLDHLEVTDSLGLVLKFLFGVVFGYTTGRANAELSDWLTQEN